MCEVAVVTTGFFDGVHLGHRHVLSAVVSAARERGEEAIVVTFWPHPRTVLQQDARDLRLLSTLEEKKEMLLAAGIDRVEVLPFTRSFAALTASEYLQMLRERFNASVIVMGYDNRIGSDSKTCRQLLGEGYSSETVGSADPSLKGPSLLWCRGWHRFQKSTHLPATGALEVAATGSGDQQPSETALPPDSCQPGQPSCEPERSSCYSESPVSSTQIRKALEEGRIEDANGMLGYRYGLYGVVVAGNRMGRTIGFPTANMQLYEPLKLVPANGVYVVEVEVLGKKYAGMCNIGLRPTVGGSARTVETHILDFDEDIYGLPLGIRFVRRLRDERKFPSLDALREQLEIDKRSIE